MIILATACLALTLKAETSQFFHEVTCANNCPKVFDGLVMKSIEVTRQSQGMVASHFGCTAAVAGRYFGRNYDWTLDTVDEYLVRVPAASGRHASIGVSALGSLAVLHDFGIDYSADDERSCLPYLTVDGVNDAGVAISCHFVELGDVGMTTGTCESSARSLPCSRFVREVLDTCASARAATELARSSNLYALPGLELQWLVADRSGESFAIGIVSNRVIVTPQAKTLVNYSLAAKNLTGELPPLSSGMEREARLTAGLSKVKSVADMQSLMKDAYYSHYLAEGNEHKWWSEMNGTENEFLERYPKSPEKFFNGDTNLFNEAKAARLAAFATERADLKAGLDHIRRTGKRPEKNGAWMTLHSCVYDLENLSVEVRLLESDSTYRYSLRPPVTVQSYFCTWATQGTTLSQLKVDDKSIFAGDQGTGSQRDNLNEEVLFGEKGWARTHYPKNRGQLIFLLDAGWDLPYGTKSDWHGLPLRGECVPDAKRFPSFKGTKVERLKALCEKIRSLGWLGTGIWIPEHVRGDVPGHDGIAKKLLSDEEMRRVLTEKMQLCREAGIAYWKVDWGIRWRDPKLRQMMTEVRDRVYPELIIEHCWVPGSPYNGVKFEKDGTVSGNGRLFGNAKWEERRAEQLAILAVSDTFRTYDELSPFSYVTTLERCAYYSQMAEEKHLPVVLNVEGVAKVAAGLGHTMGVMQRGLDAAGKPFANDACLALEWSKIAPPFGHDTSMTTCVSKAVMSDAWTYSTKDCSWMTEAIGKRVEQSAPAIVTRGMPLPEVSTSGVCPYVCGAKYPNGAVSVVLLPRTVDGEKEVYDAANVRLPIKLAKGCPLLAWGRFASLTFGCEMTQGARVFAKNLLDGTKRDISANCTFGADDTITIKGVWTLTATGKELRHGVIIVEPAVGKGGILLEAEQFADKGGWTVDSQFIDQMGSSYLLAHGLGRKVADAKTSFEVKEQGEYEMFVRTINWSARWGKGAAGRFAVAVNGSKLETELGTGTAEWTWQRAGKVALKKGRNELALCDLTGFDGRCDAVWFGPESAIRRPVAAEESRQYDFVVVGGGVAGVCAAVSAARSGLKVALVHNRPVLGGNNSSEVRVHLGGYANLPPYPRLGDVLNEFAPAEYGNARPPEFYRDDLKLKIVKGEKNLDLYLNTHANGVEKNGDSSIAAVKAVDVISGRRLRLVAPLFADATGDGTIGALAGAEFMMGREAADRFGESLAPAKADAMTMGASVQWYAEKKKDGDCAFASEEWMLGFDEKSCRPGMKGDWDWETGIGRNQITEAERIRDYGMLVVYSNWSYLKNRYSKKSEFAAARLKWLSFVAGKRESRRLTGDFILTQRHIDEREFQKDGTCATTWTIDQHYPWPESHTHFKGEPFQAESRNHLIWPYPIPFRCLYSKNIGNLLMAGRDISVSHVALGTTRLMRTHGMMGEVVGMAAAVCRAHGCSPRQVYERHFEELRERMLKGIGKPGAYAPQTYNQQSSLDPDIKLKHLESVKGK